MESCTCCHGRGMGGGTTTWHGGPGPEGCPGVTGGANLKGRGCFSPERSPAQRRCHVMGALGLYAKEASLLLQRGGVAEDVRG